MNSMYFLVDFSPLKPDFGLFFWTLVIFLLFWYIVGKLAFKPIAESLKKRENHIQSALDEAKKAKEEMQNLQVQNNNLLKEAREERTKLLNEARETKNSIIEEAKTKAKEEAAKIVTKANLEIENKKNEALREVKSEVSLLAFEIAEKVIQKNLSGDDSQKELVDTLIKKMNIN